MAKTYTAVLKMGERLTPGDRVVSENGGFFLTLQGDANLVLYAALKSGGTKVVWASGKHRPNTETFAVLQGDGNFVIYRGADPGKTQASNAWWATGSHTGDAGKDGFHGVVQNDGRFVIFQGAPEGGGALHWATPEAKPVLRLESLTYDVFAARTTVSPGCCVEQAVLRRTNPSLQPEPADLEFEFSADESYQWSHSFPDGPAPEDVPVDWGDGVPVPVLSGGGLRVDPDRKLAPEGAVTATRRLKYTVDEPVPANYRITATARVLEVRVVVPYRGVVRYWINGEAVAAGELRGEFQGRLLQCAVDVLSVARPERPEAVGGDSKHPFPVSDVLVSGKAHLAWQDDGNLVCYLKPGPGVEWASGTNGHPNARCYFQDDGNLVVYDGSKPIWATGTNGHGLTLMTLNETNVAFYSNAE